MTTRGRIELYGALALAALVLVLVVKGLTTSVQDQRETTLRVACEEGNRQRGELDAFSTAERDRVESEDVTAPILKREHAVLARIERRDAIMRPYRNCEARVHRFVH